MTHNYASVEYIFRLLCYDIKWKLCVCFFWVAFFSWWLDCDVEYRYGFILKKLHSLILLPEFWVVIFAPDSRYCGHCELLPLSYKVIKCNYYLQDLKCSVQTNHQIGHRWVTCWFNLWTGASAGDYLSQFKYDIEQLNYAYLRPHLQMHKNWRKMRNSTQTTMCMSVHELDFKKMTILLYMIMIL